MMRNLINRLVVFLPALWLVNALGFAYAHYGRWLQLSRNPMFTTLSGPEAVLPLYWEYFRALLAGDLGDMPGVQALSIREMLTTAAVNSLGLLALVFVLSLVIGLTLGLSAASSNPPRVRTWMIPISTVSMAMPSFYIGAVLITTSVYYILFTPGTQGKLPVPIRGFGWDLHLVFPTMALVVRPAMQIAQTTATLLVGQFREQYVSAARSLGHTWRLIRWKTALRNILSPVILTMAGSLRLLVGELILVEWLFGWPGLGRMLAGSLVPPNIASIARATLPETFLNPTLIAALLTILAAFFLLIDLVASFFTRLADPRLRVQEEELANV